MHSKESLKIYIDGYLLNKEPQGTLTYLRELYKEVASQNKQHQFYFGITQKDDFVNEFSSLPNVNFIILQKSHRLHRMVFEIPKLIRHHNFDYAHFQYVLPLFMNKNTKYILTIHDILFNEFPSYFPFVYRLKRNYLFRLSAKKTNFLLTVSDYCKRKISEKYGIELKKIKVSPNGVQNIFFNVFNKKDAQKYVKTNYDISKYILYVSRFEPRKNHDGLLNAFRNLKLAEKGYHLVLIGNHSIRNSAFENCMNSLNSNEKGQIHLLENITQKELMYFYQAADLFVFPSKAEGFGIPPLEAAALQVPVVCANTTAMAEFDFFQPLSIDPNNQLDLENAIHKALSDNDISKRKEIARTIRDRYTWQKSAVVINKILNE